MSATVRAVVFDFGGVLVDWDPRHLYRKLFDDPVEMERFLAEVCTSEWHLEHDRGRPMAESCRLLADESAPELRPLIEAWGARFAEMVAGEVPGTVAVLGELRDRGVPLYGLTNMPAEAMPWLRAAHPFLAWFDGIVVSGEERLVKPDPTVFRLLVDRFRLDPAATVFVDDVQRNVDAAAAVGLRAVRFESAAQLRADLVEVGLLEPAVA